MRHTHARKSPVCALGLEVALEDAMVAVLLPEYALTEYDMCKGRDDCVLPLWFGPQHNGANHSGHHHGA